MAVRSEGVAGSTASSRGAQAGRKAHRSRSNSPRQAESGKQGTMAEGAGDGGRCGEQGRRPESAAGVEAGSQARGGQGG